MKRIFLILLSSVSLLIGCKDEVPESPVITPPPSFAATPYHLVIPPLFPPMDIPSTVRGLS
ncbi:MAG: hypothetical protein ACKOW8_04065, partial [Flavobacteriales bacterium]